MDKPKARRAQRIEGKGTHGGARPGAGRKPKSVTMALAARAEDETPADPASSSQLETSEATGLSEFTQEARKLTMGALKALSEVAADRRAKASERRAAANDVLTWAYGKPMGILAPPKTQAPEKEPELGKKEALEQAANNPNTETRMGKLLAMRLPKKAEG